MRNGAPCRIRTCDPRFRKPMLYPAELRAQNILNIYNTNLENLSNSIKELGIIQPITVRKISSKMYQIISGERRLRASKIAGLIKIPCYIKEIDKETDSLKMALVENVQRHDLNAIEEAQGYQRLIDDFSYDDIEIVDYNHHPHITAPISV